MKSQFLPEDFDSSKPVALIAGKGIYPILLVKRMRAAGIRVRLVAFEAETSEELVAIFEESERVITNVGHIGKVLKSIKNFEAGYAVMAGQITPGKLFKDLKPDLKAVMMLATLKERNAETIFGAIVKEIESMGVQQLDARVFMDEDMAEEGLMTLGKLKLDEEYIQHGIKIAKENARLDVGQGVVVRKGTVLAVEAFEGTDSMLMRAGEFAGKDTLFIKTVKRNQDYRFDVPVFGLKTVQVMADSGIAFAGLEVGSTIILDKERVLAEADKLGVGIFGYKS